MIGACFRLIRRFQRDQSGVSAVEFALIDQTGARPTAVLERSVARRLDLAQASPESLVPLIPEKRSHPIKKL